MKLTMISEALICLTTPGLALVSDEPVRTVSALDTVAGLWLTASNNAEIEIADCGDGTPCGAMVEVITEDGNPAIDGNNPDPELSARPLIGVKMLHSFKEKSGRWKSGKIYNPENGKTYKSKIKLLDDGNLEVKGCIGPVCQAQIWTPVVAQ